MAAPIVADLRARPAGSAANAARLRTLLSASSRWCLERFLPDAVSSKGVLTTPVEGSARAVSAAALALAVGVRCGGFDGTVPERTALRAAVVAVRACTRAHVTAAGGWGREWQTPLVSAQLGLAAWLLWDELTATDRRQLEEVVRDEADHLARVPVHYLRDVEGHYLTEGDTGAEEESWRARGLSLALALLPDDPHAVRWQRQLVLRQLAAYARPADVDSRELLHQAPLCRWLAGSNLEPNGDLQNHLVNPQPNYMRPVHSVAAALHLRLAGRAVSPSALHNVGLLYQALRRCYTPEGGLAFPDGTDVGSRAVTLYANDVQHRALGVDAAAAQRWERLHGDLALGQVQPDGRIEEPGGTEPFGPVQPDIAAKLGEAYLALVLGPLPESALDGRVLVVPPEQERRVRCPATPRSFPDVPATFAEAAAWAAETGLVPALPDGSFRPDEPVRRSAALVSLWRAAGSPADLPPHPFGDVPHDAGDLDRAARWAVASRVSTGTSATTLSPDAPLTRGQAVVLLWRGAGRVEVPGAGPFTDVTGEVAVAATWARLVGVSTGVTATTFVPGRGLDRGQWAAMLHRRHTSG